MCLNHNVVEKPKLSNDKLGRYTSGNESSIDDFRVMRSSRQTWSGVLALLLCSIGVYGMVSFSVNRSVLEIGIRLALGADKGTVLRHSIRACRGHIKGHA